MKIDTVYTAASNLHPRLPEQVEVIDCTLRDGEQSPGVSFNVGEKVELAKKLVSAGVTVLDAGFPAASGADVEAMQAIHALNLEVCLAATARPLPEDMAAAEAARASEVFMFMPTSDFRLSETLGVSRRDAELQLLSGATNACERNMRVSLVFEDATRADPEWLSSVANNINKHVALERIVLADTVGCAWPESIAKLFELLAERMERPTKLVAHCHNDFGLAVANTLATVTAGATAITCTVNGIGERAGNADLAESVAGLTHLFGVRHGIDPLELAELSDEVARISGIQMSALKPVTGFNVFRHESGLHVDGMIKDSRSYEFLPSAWVGRRPQYVLGKHSGMAVIRELLEISGVEFDEAVVQRLLQKTKQLAESRDKTRHESAHRQHAEFLGELLSGIDFEELLRLSREEEAGSSNA